MFDVNFINKIFTRVANKYDMMNDAMSLGAHGLWKKEYCQHVENLNAKILDVASGSGDIGFNIYERAIKSNAKLDLTLSDINLEMLQLAKDRAIDNNILEKITFAHEDACNLSFNDAVFDYYTIAFGIRNIPDITGALKEAYRVLKPKSKFLCMEFSKPTAPIFKDAIKFYYNNVIPRIGSAVAGNYDAYKYLSDSIYNFPDQNIFISMMQASGFKTAYFKNLSGSLVSIYIGHKE